MAYLTDTGTNQYPWKGQTPFTNQSSYIMKIVKGRVRLPLSMRQMHYFTKNKNISAYQKVLLLPFIQIKV